MNLRSHALYLAVQAYPADAVSHSSVVNAFASMCVPASNAIHISPVVGAAWKVAWGFLVVLQSYAVTLAYVTNAFTCMQLVKRRL